MQWGLSVIAFIRFSDGLSVLHIKYKLHIKFLSNNNIIKIVVLDFVLRPNYTIIKIRLEIRILFSLAGKEWEGQKADLLIPLVLLASDLTNAPPPPLEKMFPTHGSDKKVIIIANYSLFPIN
jgi:hypothetical protein